MPIIAQIKFYGLKFSGVNSKALDVFIISTRSLILNLKRKALILGSLKPGHETLVPCVGSAATLNSAPLDGAEDPAVAVELGINTQSYFPLVYWLAIGGYVLHCQGSWGCLGLNLMQTVSPQCSAVCKRVVGSAIVSPGLIHS